MKIIVFGASRGTGLHAVQLALLKGHEITAIARNVSSIERYAETMPAPSDMLRIVKADVLSPSGFEKEMEGKDVVISSIGVTNTKPTTLYSEGIRNIINAMMKYHVKRLICVSALGVEVTPGMLLPYKLFTRFILQPLLKNNFTDVLKMEDAVKKSNLNWTIVRPPRLTNKHMTGKYRVATNEYLRNPVIISRSDLAHFIVNNIDNSECFYSRVEVAY